MPDYKTMYEELFCAATKAHRALEEAANTLKIQPFFQPRPTILRRPLKSEGRFFCLRSSFHPRIGTASLAMHSRAFLYAPH